MHRLLRCSGWDRGFHAFLYDISLDLLPLGYFNNPKWFVDTGRFIHLGYPTTQMLDGSEGLSM